MHAIGQWFIDVDSETKKEITEFNPLIAQELDHEHGDRRQEIVFINQAPTHQEEIERVLDACLVTDEEWKRADSLGCPFDESWL
jgi:hypothetical protein